MFEPDIQKLATDILIEARARGLMVVTAESCTGGLIAAALTEIAGSSVVVERGFVTYSNEAKNQMLDVSAESLRRFGAVSESVAKEMAYGALVNSRADVAVSVTGIAGPSGGSAEKPVGMVCFGVARQGEMPISETCRFGDLGRAGVRAAALKHGLELLYTAVTG